MLTSIQWILSIPLYFETTAIRYLLKIEISLVGMTPNLEDFRWNHVVSQVTKYLIEITCSSSFFDYVISYPYNSMIEES